MQRDASSKLSGLRGEQGMAMLTVLMVILMMTVLGVAAMTVSGLENNIAGLHRTAEDAAQAAESCLGTSTNVLTQTILLENAYKIPSSLLSSASPTGPVPAGNKATLEGEIVGTTRNSNDDPNVAPNISMTVGNYSVVGDIDFLFQKEATGTGGEKFCGSDCGSGGVGGSLFVYYKVDCVAKLTATGTESRVGVVYKCSLGSDGCLKAL